MDIDQVVARWETDEVRIRARLSAPDAEPKGQAFGHSGIEMFRCSRQDFTGDTRHGQLWYRLGPWCRSRCQQGGLQRL